MLAEVRAVAARAGPRLEPPGGPPAAGGAGRRRPPREPADPGARRRRRAARLPGHVHARSQPARATAALPRRARPALFVYRAHDAAPLALDGALRRRLARLPGGVRGEIGWSEATPLRALIQRLALAALLASALAALAGARLAGRWGALSLGLATPAAMAAAANAFLLAGVALNVATLVALAVAAISLLPLAALRLTRRPGARAWGWTAAAAAALVPVAVSLAAVELGPLLSEPALALLLAAGAGVLAVMLLPVPPLPVRAGGRGRERGALRSALRDPGTVVLIAATAAYLALTLFGGVLLPRPGNLRPDQGNLTAILRLPQGTPLAETVRRAAKLEEALGKAEEVGTVLDLRHARHRPRPRPSCGRRGDRRSGGRLLGHPPPVRGGPLRSAGDRLRPPLLVRHRAAASSTTSRTIRRPTRRRTPTASS